MRAIHKADKMEKRMDSCSTLTLALKKGETKLFHMLLWQLLVKRPITIQTINLKANIK